MPRKPSSIFLITQSATAPELRCERIPLTDDTTVEDILEQHLQGQPLGAVMHVVEDTKVTTYRAALTLDEVDDARLPEPTDPAAPGTPGVPPFTTITV